MAKKIQDGNQIVTNVDSNDNLTFSIKSSFIDSTPTVNSTNLVTSGGVKSALDINTTDIAAAIVRIANNETNISNHTSAIQTLNGSVSTNTTDINTLKTTTGNLSTNVNANTTKIGTLNNLTTTSKTNLVSAINELETDKLEISAVVNEASTDTDKTYSANYLNDKLVSVGTTAPTDGRRVWFSKSKNLLAIKHLTTQTINGVTFTPVYDGNKLQYVNVNGTATATAIYNLDSANIDYINTYTNELPSGTYILDDFSGSTSPYMAIFFRYFTIGSTSVTNIDSVDNSRKLTIDNTIKYASYIRINTGTTVNNMKFYPQLEKGSTATSYEPYYIEKSIKVDNEDFISMDNLVSVGANQPGDGKRVWFKKSNNLLPTNKYISTTTINGVTFTNNGDGTFNISGTATANKTIEIIPENNFQLEQGQAYYLYSSVPYNASTFNLSIAMTDNGSLKFFTANNTYTPTTQPTQERLGIYIPSGTTVNATNVKLMLVKGNTAPRVYESYVEPSINVDEEEWYNPNNIEKYSTKEIKIGTWIDGKPLYRKVVDIGTLPNATTKHVAHNISNIGSVVTLRGIVTDYRFFPVPFAATSNAYAISIFADTTNIEVMAGNDRSNMTGFVIIEYTKTTD